jgi:NADH dehydrogenase/NADH:ubiquinone oxidoreductase subunit G
VRRTACTLPARHSAAPLCNASHLPSTAVAMASRAVQAASTARVATAATAVSAAVTASFLGGASVGAARVHGASRYALRAVGALTSKPYAFQSRSWELKSTDSIDVFDGVGSNIRIDTRGSEIMRILPRLNEHVNEEWISDKSRFSYDGLKRQRLSTPMARDAAGNLVPVSWDRARSILHHSLLALERANPGGYEAHAVLGPYVDTASALALRAQIYRWFPNGQIHVQEQPAGIPTDFRHSYIVNPTIAGLEDADAVLLVGADPRKEAPLLNTRIRKAAILRHVPVASVGCATDLTYPVQHLGSTPASLVRLANGSHPFAANLAAAERPVVLVSNRALQRADGPAIMRLVEDIARTAGAVGGPDGWDGLAVLQGAANTVGLLDIGFDDKNAANTTLAAGSWSKTKFLYLLGADDIDNLDLPDDAVVVYQGHHGDRGASRASIVLPGAAYTEKNATYVNTEGRVQRTKLVFFPPGVARDDEDILSDMLGADASLQAASDKRPAPTAEILAPHLLRENAIQAADRVFGADSVFVSDKVLPGLLPTPFQPPVENFYMTDPITRSSKTMAKCTRVRTVENFV